jgi:phospholipid/cholesterol/gamma-HCH transport system substrate-binding protein
LSDLLEVTADNFGGQGEELNETIRNFGEFSQTLSDNRDEFFDSTRALQGFISTLARNDQTVRDFNQSLSEVSTVLAGERQELKAALSNLSTALGQVSGFVRENREILGRNIAGLNRFTKVLVKQRDALDEILRVAPTALNNLALTYNPQAGTLDTRANLGEIGYQITSDPATFLCGIVNQADTSGGSCDIIQDAFPRSGAFPGLQGKNARWKDRFDQSLGGLVEVPR